MNISASARSFARKKDWLILALVAIVCIALWFAYKAFAENRPATAVISVDGVAVAEIPLDGSFTGEYSVLGHDNVVFLIDADGGIRFERSDCPDQICVHAGRLHVAGESAACLPNGMILKIVSAGGEKNDEIDAIA